MRPKKQAARDQLALVLARLAPTSASVLAQALGVSVPTLHRMLPELGERLLTTGRARRTQYALRRPLRGDLADLPVYEVDEQGHAELLADLVLVHPEGSWMDLGPAGWPVPAESQDGWWGGLPYPFNDMRPQGFMGRQFARVEHRPLAVSADPRDWSDDDVLSVLTQRGSDVSGNLIVGNPAYERWVQTKLAPPEPLKGSAVEKAYPRMAEQAIAEGLAGSSAAGEFPKFVALRELAGSATPHVLVKFSGNDNSPSVRRWSDLLVCEHLALDGAGTLPGVESARSRIVVAEGRTFLEVERFDRHGLFGRSRLISLETVNASFLGESSTDWILLAGRLEHARYLAHEDMVRIQHLWWFGRLIANTDMHPGNLSFRPYTGCILAPAYDMLPMMYAPLQGGELARRIFEVALPLPPQRAVWMAACDAAVRFWLRAGQDERISEPFRGVALENARKLQDVAMLV